MKQIKIVKGNRFNIYVPVVLLTTQGASAPDMDALNVSAVLVTGCGETIEISAEKEENFVLLTTTTEELTPGVYDIVISGTYSGRAINYVETGAISIVDNNAQSNFQSYITTEHLNLDTQIFIAGNWATDEEFEALKEEYREKIAAAETATAQAEQAKATAQQTAYDAARLLGDNYAKQGSNAAATNTAILDAVNAIPGGGGGGSFPTDYAKQGNNPAATNTAILNAVNAIPGGGSFPTDYAKENTLQGVSGEVVNIAGDVTSIKSAGAKQSTSTDILAAVNAIAGTMFKGVPVVVQTSTAVNIAPNQRNVWAATINGALTVSLTGATTGIVNEYILSFVAGDGFTLTIVTDAALKWFGGDVPEWEQGATYEISIVIDNDNALILWAKFD